MKHTFLSSGSSSFTKSLFIFSNWFNSCFFCPCSWVFLYLLNKPMSLLVAPFTWRSSIAFNSISLCIRSFEVLHTLPSTSLIISFTSSMASGVASLFELSSACTSCRLAIVPEKLQSDNIHDKDKMSGSLSFALDIIHHLNRFLLVVQPLFRSLTE